MSLFLHPILFYGLGPASSLLVALLFTRRMIRRTGHPDRWFVYGLLILLALFGVQQLSLRATYIAECSDLPPGSVACEWAFVPFIVSWTVWGVGGLIYFLFSGAVRTCPAQERASARRVDWRPAAKVLGAFVGGAVFLGLLLLAGNEVVAWRQRAALSEAIEQVDHPIVGLPTEEVGKLRLPKGGFGPDSPSAIEISFSPDGHWLLIKHSDGLDIWQLPAIERVYSVKERPGLPGHRVSLSPDSNHMAIIDLAPAPPQQIELYRLTQDGIDLGWTATPSENNIYQAAFSQDGRQFLVLDSQDRLLQIDTDTGGLLDTILFSFEEPVPEDSVGIAPVGLYRPWALFSPSGAYLAYLLPAVCQVELFTTRSGDRVGRWTVSEGPCPGIENPRWGEIAFRPDDRLVWVLEDEVGAERTIWAPGQGPELALERAVAEFEWYTEYALSPDWRRMVSAEGVYATVWDLVEETAIGSFHAEAPVTALAFTPDGRLLVVGTEDGYLYFFTDRVID